MTLDNLNEKLAALERGQDEPIHPCSSKVYLLFPLLVLVFGLFFAWHNRDLLRRTKTVRVESAIAVKSTGGSQLPAGTVVFQAAGWVEADPFPTKVTSYVDGIIEQVNVIDGQKVAKGQTLALINNEELAIEYDRAIQETRQQNIRLSMAEARVDRTKAEIGHLDKRIETAKANAAKLKNVYDTYLKNRRTLSELKVEQARLDYERSLAAQKQTENEIVQFREDLKLKRQEVLLAESELKISTLKAKRLKLDLDRCQIKAPVPGVVMGLQTQPGKAEGPGRELMQIFDPASLQVRVDVLFADAPALQLNQKVEIKFDALADRKLNGLVTSIVGQADLQRNTIQAKVKIFDPDPLLRPEMLARVQFMSTPVAEIPPPDGPTESITTLVPATTLVNQTGNQAKLWVVSRRRSTLQLREVKLGGSRENNWIEILDGVNPGEWVAVNPSAEFESDQKVRVLTQ